MEYHRSQPTTSPSPPAHLEPLPPTTADPIDDVDAGPALERRSRSPLARNPSTQSHTTQSSTQPPPLRPARPGLSIPPDTSTFHSHLQERRLQDMAVNDAAQDVYQIPVTQTTQTRPIEAPSRTLTMPHNIHHLIDQLPATLEHIPNACLIRCLRIWTETLEGMVAGSQEWADLGTSFTKLLFTCFKQGEGRTKEIEYRLWYLEEGKVDQLAAYMRQRLQAHQGHQTTRRQRRAAQLSRPTPDKDTKEHHINKQVILKARKAFWATQLTCSSLPLRNLQTSRNGLTYLFSTWWSSWAASNY